MVGITSPEQPGRVKSSVEGSAYRIKGPALISFSGGRTSAYMLYQILHAHGGKLPDDVVVAFANTGKEREETLRFVHECGTRWNVPIRWIEWRDTEAGFEEVGYNSAARNGEPFSALIQKRGFVPNGVTRFCTSKLKIDAMKKFALSLGWKRWYNPVGLRYDEMHRVWKQHERNLKKIERFTALMPLADAKVTIRDVEAFWRAQPFDLGLRPYEGNCDLCFLKGRGKLSQLIRDNPASAAWWIAQEDAAASTARTASARQFREGETYRELSKAVSEQPELAFQLDDDAEFDAECGLWCAPDEQEAA